MPKDKRDPDILTAEEVAALLGIGRNGVYDAAGRGELPHRRVGHRLLFSRQALLDWMRQMPPRRAA